MYYNQRREQELYHYGVLGMKWGVRKKYDSHPRKNKRGKDDSLTSKKKYIKIGAAAVGAALVTYGGYKLYKDNTGIETFEMYLMKKRLGKKNLEFLRQMDKRKIDIGKKYVDGLSDNIGNSTLPKKFIHKSIKESIKGINPTKSNTNCRASSLASALRVLGYDVEARNIPGGSISEVIDKAFVGAKTTFMMQPSKEKLVKNITRKFEDGDVGIVTSTFVKDGKKMSHAFNAIKENGTVKFFDGQKELDNFSEYLNLIDPSMEATITNVSRLKLNWKGIYEFVKNR